tara:strand:+ start:350 stop:532 length:183 start_codon:yes stop_codon:yes gene_type:complete
LKIIKKILVNPNLGVDKYGRLWHNLYKFKGATSGDLSRSSAPEKKERPKTKQIASCLEAV